MKGGTVQILWHGSDPILSVDFHQPTGFLATAGADRDIKMWSLHRTEKSKALPSATFKANLSYHGAAVNVLRFSPSGELLASGGDNGELLIWKIAQAGEEIPVWKVWKTLRFHLKDVLDLGWSPDGAYLVSGSVDNTSIIWNVEKGTVEQVLADHLHYVQGVTWDPAGKYVASLSGDRTCRIYSMKSPPKKSKAKDKNARSLYTCQHVLCKKEVLAGSPGVTAKETDETTVQKQVPSSKQYLFYDENMPSFFRRLSWSPDGSFLLIPSGLEKLSPEAAACSVSYVVSRNDLSRPALQLPAASKPVVAARFCPVIYSLSEQKTWKHDTNVPGVGAFKLPYKLIFAVATLNSVVIYDTEQSCPIAVFAGLHYAPITDLAWSFDAKFLAVSSQDGYCTLVGFDEGELGTPLPRTDVSSAIASIQADPPVKDLSQNPVDQPSSEAPRKVAVAEKVKPPKLRRINPKPISEYLLKSALPLSAPSGPTGDSGGLDVKECLSAEVRGSQSNAEIPSSSAPHDLEAQADQIGCSRGIDRGERSGGVSSSVEYAQASTPACEAVGKETELWELQRCSTTASATEVSPKSVCRIAESCETVDLSRREEDRAPIDPGRAGPETAVPLCHDQALLRPSVSPSCNAEKPRDPYADIYVRPLKFRRISPKLISEDIDTPAVLKPLSSEPSLPLPSALQELQPT